jgi:Mor family transcriptional regulator
MAAVLWDLFTGEEVARFWSLVEKTPSCWLWRGKIRPDGYGVFRPRGGTNSTPWYRAHVLAKMLEDNIKDTGNGELLVCHRCDAPPCVRPIHLFWGTRRSNHEDCASKGRVGGFALPGEKHGQARLSNARVRRIWSLYYVHERSAGDIARHYGILPTTVWQIVRRRAWRSVTADLKGDMQQTNRRAGAAHPHTHLNDEYIQCIWCRRLCDGFGYRQIAKEYAISPSAVVAIVRGISWKHVPRGCPQHNRWAPLI